MKTSLEHLGSAANSAFLLVYSRPRSPSWPSPRAVEALPNQSLQCSSPELLGEQRTLHRSRAYLGSNASRTIERGAGAEEAATGEERPGSAFPFGEILRDCGAGWCFDHRHTCRAGAGCSGFLKRAGLTEKLQVVG